jgi:hypothetical protein
MAAGDAAAAAALDAAVHAWDVAAAAGLPSPLTARLAAALTPVARAALLRYLGRSPEWTP